MNTEQIRKEIEKRESANYSYLFLSDKGGDIMDKDNCIIHPMNRTWTKNLSKDKEKALEYIAANPDPNYPYRLGFCRKVRGVVDVVMITKEDEPVKIENELPEEQLNEIPMEDVRSFEQALSDQAKIAKLEFMIKERDRKIQELEEELIVCYEDIKDAENAQLADGTVSLINQIAPLLPALADRFFSLQERKVKAMEGQPIETPKNQETNIYQDYE